MEKQPSHTPNDRETLIDTKRIILASCTHYLALSLFFFPTCVTFTSLVLAILNVSHLKGLIYSILDEIAYSSLMIYIILMYAITQCGKATITYSTHHRVLGNPLSLLTVIKSLKCTFFPLLFTSFVADMLGTLIIVSILVIYRLVLQLGQNLGFVSDQNYVWCSLVLGVILGVILFATISATLMNWSLAGVVVVAEYKWGFSALKRSWDLSEDEEDLGSVKGSKCDISKGSKCDMLSGIYIFCWCVLVAVVFYLIWSVNLMISDLIYVLLTVFGSFFLMMVLLMVTVNNTVLYNYRKAIQDKPGLKIDQEYVDPPKDVEKVPDVVNLVIA